jgi:hypothetical protein
MELRRVTIVEFKDWAEIANRTRATTSIDQS